MRVKKKWKIPTSYAYLLMFGEIAIAPHLDYNRKKDEIVDFVNNGKTLKSE